jgi:Uma2 family endonuclease
MAEQALRLMTVDEFLAWDDGTDTRYELADGALWAMAPPDAPHRIIVANATTLIHGGLRGRSPCRPENEAGLRIDDRTMWQADIAVTCQPPARELEMPLLVVEVLSPSTGTHDLSRKLPDYRMLPSVQAGLFSSDIAAWAWAWAWRRGGAPGVMVDR